MSMSTAELIFEKAKTLPSPLQTEALHFVDYLLTRQEWEMEAANWAKLSSQQLEKHYFLFSVSVPVPLSSITEIIIPSTNLSITLKGIFS